MSKKSLTRKIRAIKEHRAMLGLSSDCPVCKKAWRTCPHTFSQVDEYVEQRIFDLRLEASSFRRPN